MQYLPDYTYTNILGQLVQCPLNLLEHLDYKYMITLPYDYFTYQ